MFWAKDGGELLMIKENETDNPVLAICYDFDKTLSPDDMQAQGYIQSIDYEVDDFWRESNELSEKNEMDRNLAYMYLMAEKSRGKVLFTKETLHNDVIVRTRENKKIETIGDFLELVKPFTGKDKEKKFLAQAFQALRIEVNDEMRALKEMLQQTLQVLKPGGRLVVITYHSLEDRLVKNFLKTGNFEGKSEQDFFGNVQTPFRMVNNKVIVPSDEEIERNPRSRSAKLRIAEKLTVDK